METLDNLFHVGGPLFMGILTILLLIILATTVVFALLIASGKALEIKGSRTRLIYIKSMGLFTMIFGILGQLVGLTEAFGSIERAGDISPGLIFGGLKVSMYTTLYGIVIYLVSILIWFLLDIWYHRKQKS